MLIWAIAAPLNDEGTIGAMMSDELNFVNDMYLCRHESPCQHSYILIFLMPTFPLTVNSDESLPRNNFYMLLTLLFLFQGWYLVIWDHCIGIGTWSCSFLEVPSNEGIVLHERTSHGLKISCSVWTCPCYHFLTEIRTCLLSNVGLGSPNKHL